MEETSAVVALSALAHKGRLEIFRLLVKAGPEGGEGNATGAGASVRMKGEAAWVNRGSIGSSGGEAGFCSLTDSAW